MTRKVEHITKPANRRVLIESGDRRQFAWNRFGSYIFDDLRHSVDTGCLMEVADAIQQSQLNPGDFGETLSGLYLVQPFRPIRLLEDLRRLVDDPSRLAVAYADAPVRNEAARPMSDPDVLRKEEGGDVHFSPGRILNAIAYLSAGSGSGPV